MPCMTVRSDLKLQSMTPQQPLILICPTTQSMVTMSKAQTTSISQYQTGSRLASILFILQSVTNARITVKL